MKPSILFSKIMVKLKVVEAKLDKVIEDQMNSKKHNTHVIQQASLALSFLLEIPNHLRKSLVTLVELGGFATSLQVSMKTGRRRAVESSHLNELARLGWLEKRREARNVVFSVSANLKGE